MKVFTDIISKDELFTDQYEIRRNNDLLYEVVGSYQNGKINIVQDFQLNELTFNSKESFKVKVLTYYKQLWKLPENQFEDANFREVCKT